jgi:hypothetical protein
MSTRPWGRVDTIATVVVALWAAGGAVFLTALLAMWPAFERAGELQRAAARGDDVGAATIDPVQVLGVTWQANRVSAFVVLAAVAGAMGAAVNVSWTLAVRIGSRSVDAGWLPWNSALPLMGTVLAVLVHLAFSAKVFGVGYDAATLQPATVAGIAGAAGLSSTTVRRWLQEGLSGTLRPRRPDRTKRSPSQETRGSGTDQVDPALADAGVAADLRDRTVVTTTVVAAPGDGPAGA